MGALPEQFAPAALRLVEAGFDVIDLNFGCPVKKVLGRCRGGFLLSRPDTALEIVARVRDCLPPKVPLTVKMRRGMDDTPESRDNFFTIFDGAYGLGVAAITVHGRTVRQRYDGPSSWDFLSEVKRHAGARIVLGSGDLFTPRDCLDMLARTGVDGVTVARGAIGNPWIFRQVRNLAAGRPVTTPSLTEQREVFVEHYRLAEQIYGLKRTCAHMRCENSAFWAPACTRGQPRSGRRSWRSRRKSSGTACWSNGTGEPLAASQRPLSRREGGPDFGLCE
jgi:tRNA-dihydrouridine synthase